MAGAGAPGGTLTATVHFESVQPSRTKGDRGAVPPGANCETSEVLRRPDLRHFS